MSKQTKVLILTSVASMVDQFLMQDLILLKKLNYKVDIACNFKDGSTFTESKLSDLKIKLFNMNIKSYHIDFSRSIFKITKLFKAIKQVSKILSNNEYEFIHCHSPIGGFVSRLAANKYRVKVIYTAHGFHFYKGAPMINWILYYSIEKFLSKKTDILITINKEDYQIANKKFKSQKIEFIPGVGIDVNKINNLKIIKTEIRDSLEIDHEDFLIISVGELNRNKNHQKMIRVISKIKESRIKYIICGKGKEFSRLVKLSQKLKIENQIKFMGFRDDVPKLLKASDIFALPSKREGLSVALMEAMASGLPVVCSNIRGNRDLVINEKNGYLFNFNQNKDLINYIIKLFNDRNLCITMGNNSRFLIKQFDIKKVDNLKRKIYKTC